jgi:hypothetical protein
MLGRISALAGPLNLYKVPRYENGLYRTTYSGYYNDDVTFFNTASVTSQGVQLSPIQDPSTDDGDHFSRQWLGYFKPPTTETYTFYLTSDDASHMWIGDNALSGYTTNNATVNNGGLHGFIEKSGSISLTANIYYPIRIMFGENTGADQMDFNYSTATIVKTTDMTGKVFYNPATNGF